MKSFIDFQTIKSRFRSEWPGMGFLFLALLILTFSYYCLYLDVNDFPAIARKITVGAFVDFMVLLIPALWWRKGRVGYTLLIVWFNALFSIANATYFSYFAETIPARSIFTADSFNSFTVKCAPEAFGSHQFLCYILPALLLSLALIPGIYKAVIRPFSTSSKVALTFLAILLFPAAQFFMQYDYKSPLPNKEGAWNYRRTIQTAAISSRNSAIWHLGPIMYAALLANELAAPSTPMTEEERREIDEYIAAKIRDFDAGRGFEVPASNKDKNLILIVVESLNGTVPEMRVGDEYVTPFLHSLTLHDSVFTTGMRVLVGPGSSSDGQFMYHTGLYPCYREPVVTHGAYDYPSIVKALRPADSREIIYEEPAIWNHSQSSRSLGYDRLDASVVLRNVDGIPQDRFILQTAARYTDSVGKRFLLHVPTIAMHAPYDFPESRTPQADIPELNATDGRTPRLNEYLRRCRMADIAIKEFIDHLRDSGQLENTVIVIASDHDLPYFRVEDPPYSHITLSSTKSPLAHSAFLAIINSGYARRDYPRHPAPTQLDLYPTLLDIFGITHYWPGFGQSLLRPHTPQSEADSLRTLTLSQRLLDLPPYFPAL